MFPKLKDNTSLTPAVTTLKGKLLAYRKAHPERARRRDSHPRAGSRLFRPGIDAQAWNGMAVSILQYDRSVSRDYGGWFVLSCLQKCFWTAKHGGVQLTLKVAVASRAGDDSFVYVEQK